MKTFYLNTVQQDATDAGISLLQTYSTCFGRLSHPSSSGVHQTVTAASGTGHSIRATTFCQRGLKLTLHVSAVYRTHHRQEYIKL